MNQSHRSSFLNDTASSVRSLMSIDSPAVRASTSRYVRHGLDDTRRTQDMSLSKTQLELSTISEFESTLNSDLSQTLLGDDTVADDGNEFSESYATLFYQFEEGLHKFLKADDPFELSKEFEEICIDHLNVFQSLKKKRSTLNNAGKEKMLFDIENMLRLERNTWRLSRILCEDRINNLDGVDDSMMVDEGILSDSEVMQSVFDKNHNLRRMQLIIDWLEQNEQNDMQDKDDQNNIQFYSEGPHYWENTLHLAKNKRNKLSLKTGERELNVEMDPDAPFRSQKALHDLDKEDESRMLRYIFRYLRAGQLHVGKELAQKLGFYWLTAALDGWLLHHDPKFSGNVEEPIDGNPRRDLWKYTCWQSAKISEVSAYEKAVFGSLSGNVNAMLPVCPKWSDKLWALLRASIDTQLEMELRNAQAPKPETARNSGVLKNSKRFSVFMYELPDEYWNSRKSTSEVFSEIDHLVSEQRFSGEEKCHMELQKFVSVGDTSALLDSMIKWIGEKKDEPSYYQMLRFFAHLVLFYQSISFIQDNQVEKFVSILEAYIEHLVDRKLIQLVATYVVALPKDRQTTNYAKLLAKIINKDERKQCLKLAEESGLDIESITKAVVEAAIPVNVQPTQLNDSLLTATSSVKTTPDDQLILNSMEWLLLNQVQYIELLKQGNALMRSFALQGKIEASKETIRRLPLDLMDGVYRTWYRRTGQEELSPELNTLAREFLCFKAFFEAMDSFNHWVRFYQTAKPTKPAKLASAKFTDKVRYEQLVKGYENDLQQWKLLLASQAKLVAEKIFNVLQFPDGGWMTDTESRVEHPGNRSSQLEMLRKQFIPQLSFILHSVLTASNNIKESIQLADVIASEDYQLYNEFTQEQLKDLLRRFRESSLTGMSEAMDYLGYTIESSSSSS
ncbi:Nuclear pore complex protein [Halotydeus destructor]|nr:Nuclear pore complex protein [Halotydeus destructor]